MPTHADQARSEHQASRASILRDDFDDLAREWMLEFIDEEVLSVWGIPDTSANPLAVTANQLTTPGLYSTRPRWRHANTTRNEGLIGPGGQLDRAGYHTGMKDTQFMAVGQGNRFSRFSANTRGQLTVRSVAPQNVYVRCPDDDPTSPDELWELRLRYWVDKAEWIYTWDAYTVRDGEDPTYRILAGDSDQDGNYEDLSHIFLVRADGTTGAMVGPDYPWKRMDASARLPFVSYRSANAHSFWNTYEKRGLHRGTLYAVLYATYTGHAARAATGTMALIAGLDPVSVDVQEPQGTLSSTATRAIRTIKQTPGALIYHQIQEGITPFVKELGAGVNLDSLAAYADGYEQRQALRSGLSPSDAEKQSANPTSGAALTITNSEKRSYSEQVTPLFRESDLDAVELAAIVLRAAGAGDYDETGYTITYHTIPLSPTEDAAKRDALQAEVSDGMISRAEQFQRLNPGTSLSDAVSALVDAAVTNARISAETEAQLTAAGLAPPTEDQDSAAFNEVTLAIERLSKVGDIDGINQLRETMAQALGVAYAGPLTELPGIDEDPSPADNSAED